MNYCLSWEATQRNALPGLHWSLQECSQLLLEAGILCTACWKEGFLKILLKNITKINNHYQLVHLLLYACFLLSSFLLPSYLHNTVSPKQVKGFPMGQKDLSWGLEKCCPKKGQEQEGQGRWEMEAGPIPENSKGFCTKNTSGNCARGPTRTLQPE